MKSKKIYAIVIAVVTLIIATSFILFAFINKNYSLEINEPTSITVYTTSNSASDVIYNFGDTEENYQEIMKKFNASFKTSFLSALFQGKAFNNAKVDEIAGKSITSLKNSVNEDKILLYFEYNSEQAIKINGKNYKPHNSNDITYFDLYVEVNGDSSLSEVNCYICTSSSSYAYYKFTTYANQASLFNYLTEMYN